MALASATRACFGSGQISGAPENVIDYITIANTGNASDFGDMVAGTQAPTGLANDTRGIWAGGSHSGNVIQYITIASTGNANDFGDLTQSISYAMSTSSPTRGIIAGGNTSSATVNNIEYITISTTGNATDFGDLIESKRQGAGVSDYVK